MLTHKDIIRAWKDPMFRLNLSDAERAQLPENPAGLIQLTDADLDAAAGGDITHPITYTMWPDLCMNRSICCPLPDPT